MRKTKIAEISFDSAARLADTAAHDFYPTGNNNETPAQMAMQTLHDRIIFLGRAMTDIAIGLKNEAGALRDIYDKLESMDYKIREVREFASTPPRY